MANLEDLSILCSIYRFCPVHGPVQTMKSGIDYELDHGVMFGVSFKLILNFINKSFCVDCMLASYVARARSEGKAWQSGGMPLNAMFPSNTTSGDISNQKRLKKKCLCRLLCSLLIRQLVGSLWRPRYGNTIIWASVSEPHTNEFNGRISLIDYVRIVCRMFNAQVCMPCAGNMCVL